MIATSTITYIDKFNKLDGALWECSGEHLVSGALYQCQEEK